MDRYISILLAGSTQGTKQEEGFDFVVNDSCCSCRQNLSEDKTCRAQIENQYFFDHMKILVSGLLLLASVLAQKGEHCQSLQNVSDWVLEHTTENIHADLSAIKIVCTGLHGRRFVAARDIKDGELYATVPDSKVLFVYLC